MELDINGLLFPDGAEDRVGATGAVYGKSLSPREVAVIRLKMEGQSGKEAAYTLSISEQTVKNHVSTVLIKTGAPNMLALCVRVAQAQHGPDCGGGIHVVTPDERVAQIEHRLDMLETGTVSVLA